MGQTNKKYSDSSIAINRKARHDYFIEEVIETGLVLEGWEVKSIRQGKAQLVDSRVIFRRDELWLIGAHITPLLSASTHIHPDPTRTRKLLLHRKQINKLIGTVERKGYTLIPLELYWKNNCVKVSLAVAKGKKQHDKRATLKERDWERQKGRMMRNDWN